MGKKRIIKKNTHENQDDAKSRILSRASKNKIVKGILHIESTYNNTRITLTDESGNAILWGSAVTMGFKGTKKSTPYAASKIANVLGEKSKALGLREVEVIVKGVGAGRESAIRSFVSSGIDISSIKDKTPVPHNGPKPPKPRRV